MHGLALNITIQTYAGHVDFGIIADKKALPHANDLAKAIEAAFKEALDLLAMTAPAPAPAVAVKTRKSFVPQVTKAASLEKLASVKPAKRHDTVLKSHNTKTPHASSHGKPVIKTPAAKAVKRGAGTQAATRAPRSTT